MLSLGEGVSRGAGRTVGRPTVPTVSGFDAHFRFGEPICASAPIAALMRCGWTGTP